MKTLMIAAALCAGMLSAQAQNAPTDTKTSATTPQKPMDHTDCLQTTDADWTAMGLSAEQMTKVKEVQMEHQKTCVGMKQGDGHMAMMVDKHEGGIKEVLTPAQYDTWKKQCAAMATPAKPMEKK